MSLRRCTFWSFLALPHFPVVAGRDRRWINVRSLHRVVSLAVIAVFATTLPAEANHYYTNYGWRDKHVRYPSVPSGYSQIVNVFGKPCNAAVNDNMTYWTARDDHHAYPVYY